MKHIVITLSTSLAVLLILLLSGWRTLGWVLVVVISVALIFIMIGRLIIVPFMNWQDKNAILRLERIIKDKEKQGYTEEKLEDLNRELYLMKKTHELA